MHHDLKTVPVYFGDIQGKQKTWDIRLDDRMFLPGDSVTFHEYERGKGYTGKNLSGKITHAARLTEIDLDEYIGFSFELDV